MPLSAVRGTLLTSSSQCQFLRWRKSSGQDTAPFWQIRSSSLRRWMSDEAPGRGKGLQDVYLQGRTSVFWLQSRCPEVSSWSRQPEWPCQLPGLPPTKMPRRIDESVCL